MSAATAPTTTTTNAQPGPSPTNAPRQVKKWTQLSPEDFTIAAGNTPSVKRRHSAPPDQLLFHTYPHNNNQNTTNPPPNNNQNATSSSNNEPSQRYVFHHHPYMSKGRRNSSAGTPSPPPPSPAVLARRGSTPAATTLPPPTSQFSAPGPRRRLSLPHNSYNKQQQLPSIPPPSRTKLTNSPPSQLPPVPSVPLNLSQYKLCPLIEIVEEEIEHAKEFEMHKIHEATAKMHISNLIL